MKRFLFLALAGYLFIVFFMYFMQRQMQYYPDRRPLGAPKDYGAPFMETITAKTEDGLSLAAWFVPPKEKDGRIVVIYHGNKGHIGYRAVKAHYFAEKGYGVYMCEYRGYGGNKGSPSEEGLYKDARSALKWLEEKGYSPAQFVIYGDSLGSGVAVQMALEIQPKILILEAPFSSAVDVAKTAYPWLPVDFLMKDKYDSFSKIGKINSSLLIVHGDEDMVVPISLSQKLYETANHPKEYVTIHGGGHNDLYDHHAGHIISEWLDQQP